MAPKNIPQINLSSDLSAQTMQNLGLSKQPFASEILSDKSFFNTQALDKISDSLIHQVQFSELLLIIEGPHGSGKTSLFRQFIQSDISNTKILSMQAEATDTLVQIQQKMSIHLQDLGDANHLDENLKSLQMFDQTPLVVIDSAHVLSDTTLQKILRYQQQLKQEHDITLKLLLFANTGIAETLQKISDIQTDQMYVQSMPEYTAKQIESFIKHKLLNADYNGEALLDSNHIQQLSKKSNGTPLNIMHLAAPMIDKIIMKKVNPASNIWKKILLLILILTVFVGGALAAYFLLIKTRDTTTADISTTDTTGIPSEAIFINDKPADDLNKQTTPEIEPDIIDALENDKSIKPVQIEPVEANIDIPATDKPVKDKSETDKDETINIIPKTAPETSPVTKQLTEKPIKKVEVTQTNTLPATVAKPVATHNKSIRQASETLSENIKSATETKQKKPVSAVTPFHPALKQLKALGVHNANWLKQQPESNWTLQFLGARGPSTLLKFSRQHKLGTSSAWYKTQLKGKAYYVLVYGSYPDKKTARNAINELSPQLRAIKPWIKSIKSVQQALK